MDGIALDWMGWQAWAGALCCALLTISYLTTNMWWLRLLALSAMAVGAVLVTFGGSAPLWVAIGWIAVLVLINGAHLVQLTLERLNARLDEQGAMLHQGPFAGFNKVTFARLLRAGTWRDVPEGTQLTREGAPVEDLMVIGRGSARVEVAGRSVALLQQGSFIGEMSLLTDGNATASVTTTGACRLFTLPKTALAELCERDSELDAALHGVLSRDLVKKLIATRQQRGIPAVA